MARSLLRQLEQIRRAATYDDAISGINTSAVAEPTVSGSLEEDTNVIRSLLKQVKGTTNWFDDLGMYYDPTNTDAASSGTKQMSLNNIKGNTLDAKTIIIAVSDDNSGNGYTVSGTSTGVLVSSTTRYATSDNRTGLPIYESTTNSGSYHDEAAADSIARIDVVDTATDSEFVDGSGYTVYAKFHDGADFSGSGDGTDVYARFYANGSVTDLSTVSGVSNIQFIYPQRKVLSNMEEYEWLRTDFVSSWEGDVELMEDIQNLWSYTGASNDDDTPQPWTNTSASYILASNPDNLQGAIDDINTGIGSRLYSENNYLGDGESISTSLNTLDQELQDVADSVSAGVGEKYVESVSVAIDKNTSHSLPYSITYTPVATAGREGMNMDVYVDGQLLAADTGTNGANADRDYAESDTDEITFRFDIQVGRNITYVVRQ